METTTTDVGADKAPKDPWNLVASVDPSRRWALEERLWRIVWTAMAGVFAWKFVEAVGYLRQIALKD